jgi:hypothetical protein
VEPWQGEESVGRRTNYSFEKRQKELKKKKKQEAKAEKRRLRKEAKQLEASGDPGAVGDADGGSGSEEDASFDDDQGGESSTDRE